MTSLGVGLIVMVGGISLMIWHWFQWNIVARSARTAVELRYSANQFRRRVLIGSLMAITGSVLISLKWTSDHRVFTASILLLLFLLVCILVLAILDLMNVFVHLRLGPISHEARARLIHKYEQRKKEQNDDQPKQES